MIMPVWKASMPYQPNTNNSSWYDDYSYFPNSGNPFFHRVGSCNYFFPSGLFWFNYESGAALGAYGFRPVLIVL